MCHTLFNTNGPSIKIKQRDSDTRQRWWWREGCDLYNWLFDWALYSSGTSNQPSSGCSYDYIPQTFIKLCCCFLNLYWKLPYYTPFTLVYWDFCLWICKCSSCNTAILTNPITWSYITVCKYQKVMNLSSLQTLIPSRLRTCVLCLSQSLWLCFLDESGSWL